MDNIVSKNGRIWISGGRELLLKILPKYSIGLEIGVHQGSFSQKILELVEPKKTSFGRSLALSSRKNLSKILLWRKSW